jgi:hypothetical protein
MQLSILLVTASPRLPSGFWTRYAIVTDRGEIATSSYGEPSPETVWFEASTWTDDRVIE